MEHLLELLPFLCLAMAANKRGIEAGQAYVKAWLDDSAISRGLKGLRAKFSAFSAGLAHVGSKLLAAGGGLAAVFAAPLKRSAMLEMLEADFTVLLGSVTSAKKLLQDFRTFAKDTPLEFLNVAESGKQLLNWKLATEKTVVDVLRKIGDASGGIPDRMEAIIRGLGQMRATGRIQADEMNQLTEAGLPAWELLAKVLGTDVAGAMKLVTARQVDATQVVPKFIDALGEFGNGRMAAQARTLAGRFSNLKDAFWEAVTPLGDALLPYAGKLLTIVATLVDDVGGWIKANAAVAVKLVLVAAAVMGLGAAAIGASVAIRAADFAISGLAIVIRLLLLPTRLAVSVFHALAAVCSGVLAVGARAAAAALGLVSLALRTVAAAATLTAATIRGFAATIAASAGVLRLMSVVTAGVTAAVTLLGAALQITKRITASTAVTFRLVAGAVGVFTFATRIAAMAVVASAGLVRLAGAAFATFGAIVNTTALAISGLGTVLMLLGNPIGGTLVAIGLIGAALYYARGVSLNFGAALDWLKARFGSLADQALAAFSVMQDAILAGDWKTAGTLLWDGLKAAFLRGKIEVLKIWDDLTSGLRESLTQTLAGLAGKFTEWSFHAQAAAQDAYAVLLKAQAGFARLMGRDELADTLEQDANNRTGEFGMSANLRRQAAGQGEKTTAGILAAGAKSVADTKALREQQEQEAAAAERAFAASTAASKAAVAAAKAAATATPAATTGTNTSAAANAATSVKTSTAINTAAVVGTQAGQEALFKALGGSVKGITPGDRLIADALAQQNALLARQHREAMRNSGGPPLKVEKVA